MNLNRITLNIFEKTAPGDEYCKEFGSLLRYLEDVIFHHLGKRFDFGGYRIYHTLLYDQNAGENEVIKQGQILKVHLKASPIDFSELLKMSTELRLERLLEYLSKSIQTAEENLNLNSPNFHDAIENAKATGLRLKPEYDKFWSEYYKVDKE